MELVRRAYVEYPAGRLDQIVADTTTALTRLEATDPFRVRYLAISVLAFLTVKRPRTPGPLLLHQR